MVPEIIPFVKDFKNATSLCSKRSIQVILLRKHVSMPMKFLNLNLLLILTTFSKRNWISLGITLTTRTQLRLYKKEKFCDTLHGQGKCRAYQKLCYVCNKKNHFKVCCQCVRKKVHEMEKDESDESPTRAIMNFLFKLLISRTLYILTKSRIKNLINNSVGQ